MYYYNNDHRINCYIFTVTPLDFQDDVTIDMTTGLISVQIITSEANFILITVRVN